MRRCLAGLSLGVLCGVAAAAIASDLFGSAPDVQDAIAYLYQARTLALSGPTEGASWGAASNR